MPWHCCRRAVGSDHVVPAAASSRAGAVPDPAPEFLRLVGKSDIVDVRHGWDGRRLTTLPGCGRGSSRGRTIRDPELRFEAPDPLGSRLKQAPGASPASFSQGSVPFTSICLALERNDW
ncbi:hypothetical protein Psuf_005530 [Phytohabitans suffuscus]|uniref:Uncharacterized protein n=1 Tax=Phytohabitans suffuscus TaxID=624315 RepID=A0A6F8YB11_9ACTN|nr:hypothetical protein Psuf_005530 [Phytohabitans suffuscus]